MDTVEYPLGGTPVLRVMVVDDEAIVRRDIRHMLDWQRHGYVLAAEAENGWQALQLLEETAVDIIIADIQMPRMSGLELAAQVLAEGKAVKFIFLTAFSSFDFARSSLRLGVDAYILKHEINDRILLAELVRLRQDLERLSHQKAARINDAMQTLLAAPLPPEKCKHILAENGIVFRRGGTFLLRIELREGEASEQMRGGVMPLVYRAAQQENVCGCTVFSLETASVGALIALQEAGEGGTPELAARSCVNRIQEQLRALLGAPFFIFVGPILEGEEALYQSSLQLKKAAGQRYFVQTPRSIFCEPSAVKPPSYEGEVSLLCQMLEKRQYPEAEKHLRGLFTQALSELNDVELFKEYLVPITERLAGAWNREHDGSPPMAPIALYQEVLALPNIFEACERLDTLLKEMKALQTQRHRERAHVLKSYIDEHFAEDITLEQLGGLIGVSAAYVSQLFKRQMGLSFKTHLKNVRMKKAEEMLMSGRCKIQDIGERVGYSSTPYFCLVFKQHFGLTPSEYIERHRG